ncbi:Ankyrin repeat-containing protein ITN1 [Linum perenne]
MILTHTRSGNERDLEKGFFRSIRSSPNLLAEGSSLPSPSSTPRGTLVLSNSGKALLGKRYDRKKYVKQVTGRHNDTELHLAAQRGDLAAVRHMLEEISAQMMGTLGGADFDAEVSEIRSAVVNEVNELGETALFTAAEKGHLDIVKELLQFTTKQAVALKNKAGFDALHIAASQGHQGILLNPFELNAEIVKVLLELDPSLSKTVGQSNASPLVSAAAKGHTRVVEELLAKDPSLLDMTKSNGKNALHLAARQGYVEIVSALLERDPQLARRTDKKGQTALHMAVKGVSSEVVRLLLSVDAAIVMLPDRHGNTALHVIVHELLYLPDTNVNALTRDHKTAIDIANGLPLSEEISEIKEILYRHGAVKANDLNQPRDELRRTVKQIKKEVHIQLEQTRKTNKNVDGIAKDLRRLHREGINNATNSVTVVAVLFATVAFAAIFTVPGGDGDDGTAVVVSTPSFKVFFIFNAVALFTSLAVVVVQITIVRGETNSARRVVEVINKLMWLASVCTTVAFISSAYIVVGRRNRWAAILITVIGGVTMAGVLGTMTFYVMKSRRIRRRKRREKSRNNGTGVPSSSRISDSEPEVNPIYAL